MLVEDEGIGGSGGGGDGVCAAAQVGGAPVAVTLEALHALAAL